MVSLIDVATAAGKLQKTCTSKGINQGLALLSSKLLEDVGSPAAPGSPLELYTRAVQGGFYSDKPLLDAKYRECSVLALLVSQGAEVNLALHVFIALMVGLTPDEIVNIVFATGIYCGVNRFTSSLGVVEKAFNAVIQAANDGENTARTPLGVFKRIGDSFQPTAAQTTTETSVGEKKRKGQKQQKKQKKRKKPKKRSGR